MDQKSFIIVSYRRRFGDKCENKNCSGNSRTRVTLLLIASVAGSALASAPTRVRPALIEYNQAQNEGNWTTAYATITEYLSVSGIVEQESFGHSSANGGILGTCSGFSEEDYNQYEYNGQGYLIGCASITETLVAGVQDAYANASLMV